MIETVYLNRDNPVSISVKQDGVLMDFSAVTRMVLSFAGSTVVADSDEDASLIDWSQGSGVVVFNLKGLAIDSGSELFATLVVYDATHTDGQVLISGEYIGSLVMEDSRKHLRVRFVDDSAA